MGTNFQFRVWEALLAFQPVLCDIWRAGAGGRSGAPEQWAALASNPVGVLIPVTG